MSECNNYNSCVGAGLQELRDGLSPIVTKRFAELLGDEIPWPNLLRTADENRGGARGRYDADDLALMIRAMSEQLGTLGYPFSEALQQEGRAYVSEVRAVRNSWAHNRDFDLGKTRRALETIALLLRLLGSDAQGERVDRILGGVQQPISHRGTEGNVVGAVSLVSEDVAGLVSAELPVSVAFEALDTVSYAMAHNAVTLVSEITLDSRRESYRAASLVLSLETPYGDLAVENSRTVDLLRGDRTIVRDVRMLLDAAAMNRINEEVPGTLLVSVHDEDGSVVGEHRSPIRVLAAEQWLAAPRELGIEMLAAHVQPNSPHIAELLLEVSEKLQASTGSSAIDGYQSADSARADAIAQAVYDSMAARDVRYAEPPASWARAGQKVRTPEEVLVRRLGTCLDTAVTMAAALERSGIWPLLWLLPGHVVVGYWREPKMLDVTVETQLEDVQNLVQLGEIQLIETTALTGGEQALTFVEAASMGRSRVLGLAATGSDGVLDLMRARQARIFPLPSRAISADGSVVVHEYATASVQARLEESYSGVSTTLENSAAPQRVERWKNALLDLSLRNRLINYSSRYSLQLVVPEKDAAELENLVNSGRSIELRPNDAISEIYRARGLNSIKQLPAEALSSLLFSERVAYVNSAQDQYTLRLRALAKNAKTILEETGSNNLFLSFGMLNWKIGPKDLRSPLVLVPVSLTSPNKGQQFRLSIDEAETSTPNFCLLEKLQREYGLNLTSLSEPTADDSGIDLVAALDGVRRAILEAKLPFTVDEEVNLSILQFSKFRLWKDLDEHWEEFEKNPLVTHLIHSPNIDFVDPVAVPDDIELDALGAMSPVPADATQLGAVAEAVAGRTFVLEGPPGTGKSQTITNLLAQALVEGKRVLFVAEKRAALEVVQKRLVAVGLGALALELHDKGARPQEVRSQLLNALELEATPSSALFSRSLQSVTLDAESLSQYANRLHSPSKTGLSLYGAHNRVQELFGQSEIEFPVPATFVATATEADVERVRSSLREVHSAAELVGAKAVHPWGFVEGSDSVHVSLEQAIQLAGSLSDTVRRLDAVGIQPHVAEYLAVTPELATWLQLLKSPQYSAATLAAFRNADWRRFAQDLIEQLDALRLSVGAWCTKVSLEVLRGDVQPLLLAAQAADRAGIFGRKRARRAIAAQLSGHLLVEQKQLPLSGLTEVLARVHASQQALQSVRAQLQQVPEQDVPVGWWPFDDATYASTKNDLLWRISVGLSTVSDAERQTVLDGIYLGGGAAKAGEALQALQPSWSKFGAGFDGFSEATATQQWCGNESFFKTLMETSAHRSASSRPDLLLRRWIDFIDSVNRLKELGLEDAAAILRTGQLATRDAFDAFEIDLAKAVRGERSVSEGLEYFDAEKHRGRVESFLAGASSLRKELPRVLPDLVLERRTIDADQITGRIGNLKRQLNRQRGGMRVRQLFEEFGDVILQITPCVLMSPSSVAQFFPAVANQFDIVVFDEASQIRVADAVGAMGRGKSVVIVGDSKQMPPTSFGESAGNGDESPSVAEVVDEESILSECVQAQVSRKWLSWHYRSQDEALIAFSNRHYYDGRLSSFPSPASQRSAETGLSLVRVNGTFRRDGKGAELRTNLAEAQEIVEEIRKRFARKSGAPSIGIVTFNVPQRNLIDSMLRDLNDTRILESLEDAEGLFVKNLENVQGDERDSIFFSVAFSANERGEVPLNFGPLTRTGGERRLNVAITRARREVKLFCSFSPESLRAERSTSVGLKHLKEYLLLAERGAEEIERGLDRKSRTDAHRDDVANELRMLGFAVQTDVGLSDFRVDISVSRAEDPNHPVLAILLDGEGWSKRGTVSDRDGLPATVLKNMMGWAAVERVWLPEWLEDRASVVARLGRAVELGAQQLAHADTPDHSNGPAGGGVEPTPQASENLHHQGSAQGDLDGGVATPFPSRRMLRDPKISEEVVVRESSAKVERKHSDTAPYVAWVGFAGNVETLDSLTRNSERHKVQEVMREIVRVEGPMQKETLARKVAGAFGLGRVSPKRVSQILGCLPSDLTLNDVDGSVWPSDLQRGGWRTAYVVPAGEQRSVESVTLVELANAIRIVAEESAGAEAEALMREAALRFYGIRRLGKDVNSRLLSAISVGLNTGRLVERSGMIFADS